MEEYNDYPRTPDNTNIINEYTYEPNVNQTNNYVPALQENIYEFMTHSFHGSGGYRDGSYLVPHKREMFYDGRRDLAYYRNYLQPIVSAMVEPVFVNIDEMERKVFIGETEQTDGMFINGFIEDATNDGTSLHMYTKDAIETAWLHGVTFTVVDNFSTEEMPDIKADAINGRKYPYVYKKEANQVEDITTDRFGNLEEIIFIEEPEIVKNASGRQEKEKRYGLWNIKEYKKLKKDETGGYVVIETIVHGLNKIPVIPTMSVRKKNQKKIMVDPPLYDIAKMNHTVFNKDSEARDLERSQGFSVLCVQNNDPSPSLTIGANNVLFYPEEASNAPSFASPDPNILVNLVENCQKVVDEIYRIAAQNGVIGVQSQQSGIAKEWDFRALEGTLLKTSAMAADLEYKIIELFQLYTNENFDYVVSYPDEFQPTNVADLVLVGQGLLDMGMVEMAAAEVRKHAFKMVMSGKITEEKMAEVIEQFDTVAIDENESNKDEVSVDI